MAASASPTAMSHPIPLRSADSPTIDLAHPTPDLGTYTSSIERLEDQAERMSSRGSDIGEEIRKLQLEQKLSDSRRSSLHSGPLEEATRPFSTRSRNASTSSYANSVIDVNGAARWGGYSPAGFVTSPVGSLRSAASFNQSQLPRQRSGSRASRLGQVVHTEDAYEESPEQGGYPDSPHSPRSAAAPGQQRDASPPPQSQRSASSFTRRHDQMIQEIQDELHQAIDPDDGPGDMRQEHFADERDPRYHDYPDRPPTAASTDTTHQARTLWQDFDGVHCPDTVIEEEPTPSHRSGSGSRHSSLLRTVGDLPPQGAPPPADGMVFYPAPVPKMLNLPKRLSQAPAANVQAKRRTQLLESMNVENRKSAAWLPDDVGATSSKPNRKSMDPRMSRMSLAGLPPQLRASAYFDQVGPAQEFEVKGESAEDTLDSILEASAHAPVSAFTDHPFAGHSGADIYAPEHARKPSKAPAQDKVESRKSRSSLNLLDTRRNSSGDPLNKLKKRNSSHDLNMLTVRASTSRMSLGDELDDPDREDRGPDAADDLTPTARSIDGEHVVHPDDQLEGEEEEEEEAEEEPQYFGPPTTLLAELQMRKQQQKSRNLTAATAFPNGMHATLLELDAVAEIEKKKRKGQKVNLAWEAPPLHGDDEDDSDDDVPLGLLFPGRDGLVNNSNNRAGAQQRDLDWDRPLGLIAQRELEDNEPLSRRRNRLLGVDPNRPLAKRNTQAPGITLSQQHLAVPSTGTPQPESDGEDEVETLAQRLRRLKDRQALDNALDPGVRKSTVSGDFAAEMMSQFGLPEEEEAKQKPAAGEEVEETLGQRRERLRAEAVARGDANPMGTRPPLRASLSMADILAANPLTNSNSARKVSDEQLLSSLPQGSLLLQNEQKQSQRRADRINVNSRISSYGNLDKPLLGDVGKGAPEQPIDAKIQAYKEKMYGAATPQTAPISAPSMMFTPNMNGSMLRTVPSMNFPGQRDSYFPQANMGMNAPLGMNPMNPMMQGMNRMSAVPNGFGMPGPNMMPQQMMGMPMGMNNGMGMNMGMPMGGMPGMTYPYPQMNPMGGMHQPGMGNMPMPMNGMSMQDMAEMDQRQRDMVDRWRQTIVP
ncbi:hypothetical protein BCR34DRAFT_579515 [Clohesyomyces aquaticus]|uniref:Uncharacterized protein n=1 Tax=Clohesyomyces aquaticus TaxID=1231657 RepID=A0A1Y1YB17_9PLEO|nr:hypothetical protein BCR34DRAFT_579515 [Clohesyomyces aquaticus]